MARARSLVTTMLFGALVSIVGLSSSRADLVGKNVVPGFSNVRGTSSLGEDESRESQGGSFENRGERRGSDARQGGSRGEGTQGAQGGMYNEGRGIMQNDPARPDLQVPQGDVQRERGFENVRQGQESFFEEEMQPFEDFGGEQRDTPHRDEGDMFRGDGRSFEHRAASDASRDESDFDSTTRNFYDRKIEDEYLGSDRRGPIGDDIEGFIFEAIGILREVLDRVSGTPAEEVITGVIEKLRNELVSGADYAEDPLERMHELMRAAQGAAEEAMGHASAPEEFIEADIPGAADEMRRIIFEVVPPILSIFENHGLQVPAVAVRGHEEAMDDFEQHISPICEEQTDECLHVLLLRQQRMQEDIVEPMMAVIENISDEEERKNITGEIESIVSASREMPEPMEEFQAPEGEGEFPFEEPSFEDDVQMQPVSDDGGDEGEAVEE